MRSLPSRPTDEHAHNLTVTFDIETIVEDEPQDGSFPPWPRHRPVAAAFLTADWRGEPKFTFDTLVCMPGDEEEFYEQVDGLLPEGITSVTYNGRGFDLRVLQLGAMATHRFDLSGLRTHAQAHRYGRTHCDLADQFSGYGATRTTSLAELCHALQIPIKTSVSGADVGTLWRAGRIADVEAYVREDVAATYILWLYWSAFRASDDRLIAVPLDAFARFIEQMPNLEHLLPFATCPPSLWARPRALFHRIAAARIAAEHRTRREEDERAFSASDY